MAAMAATDDMNLKRLKRWLVYLFAGVLILVAALYIGRKQVKHAIFAYEASLPRFGILFILFILSQCRVHPSWKPLRLPVAP
jgi:hypothetical protein